MRIRTTIAVLLVSSLLCTSSIVAEQRHVVDPAQLQQAIADQVLTDQQNRAAVLGLLERSQVREVANRLGLSVAGAESAVSSLSSAELARVAAQARTAEEQLAGGSQKIVISLTTLLLIIIIVLLVAR